jgi:hypothetical protein
MAHGKNGATHHHHALLALALSSPGIKNPESTKPIRTKFMNTTSRISLFLAAASLAVASSASAAIVAYSSTFSSSGSIAGWTSVGATPAVIKWDSANASNNDYDKLDLVNTQANPLDGNGIVGDMSGDTEAMGDGVQGDGGLWFDTFNATAGDEAIAFTLSGTIALGEQYNLSIGAYNDGLSFYSGSYQLYNLTDATVLASVNSPNIIGSTGATYKPVDFTLSYTALASDVGDQLQIRFVEAANNSGRDLYVDNLSLAVIPEPSVALLGGLGVLALLRRRRG